MFKKLLCLTLDPIPLTHWPLAETPTEYFTYTSSNNTITITGYTGTDSQVVIPQTIDNLPVTTIEIFAFNENTSLKSIQTSHVTTINDFAFASCTSLETVLMPEVKTLGANVFSWCSNLVDLDAPNVTLVGSSCFSFCKSLYLLQLPKVLTISDFAFLHSSIHSVDMPNVLTLDTQAFSHCESLDSINICQHLSTIGLNVFLSSTMKNISIDYGMDDISQVTLSDWNAFVSQLTELDLTNVSGKYIKNDRYIADLENQLIYAETVDYVTLVKYTGSASHLTLPSYLIGKPLLSIGNYVFQHCNSLISLTMPSVLTIGGYAFDSCENLQTIIGDYVTFIGDHAFKACSSLINVELPMAETIGTMSFSHCTQLKTIDLNQLRIVGTSAFDYCTALEKISLLSATTLYAYAFYHCIQLKTIDLPNVIEIQDCAFNECYLLESLSLPSLKILDNFVFYNCSKLLTIDLSNISEMGFYVFESCEALNKVIISKDVILGSYNFLNCPITNVTMYYGTEDISTVTIIDWNHFVTYLGLDPSNIPGKYVMNMYGIRNLYDITPPVITLLGDNPMSVNVGTAYVEPGAIVTDDVDTDLQVVISGSVDTTKVGTNAIYYNATDLSGNQASQVIRTVHVIDTIPPVIMLNGGNPMVIEVNTPYTEPGATVIDNIDTGLQATITGTVDTTKLGTNYIYYNASDLSGNQASQVIRTVNIVDTIAPIITLNGENTMIVEVNTPYVEPGAVVTDNFDTHLQATLTGSVDTSKLGTNYVYYNATDSSGNQATECVREVDVVDTIAPIIILNGDNPISVNTNTPYVEFGAIVTDNFDTDLQAIITGEVDTTTPGHYLIYYNATDNSGNQAIEVVRTVNVIDTTTPVIVLKGSNPMHVEINTPYIEPGAIVTDDVDTDLQPIIAGEVDTSTAGKYSIYYNATDSSGNQATEVVRTVNVSDTTAPIITLNGDYRVYLDLNTPYVELGAIVTDNLDTGLQPVITGHVDTTIVGEYPIYYNATDTAGNQATEVIRTIYVSDPLADFCYTITDTEVIITCYKGIKPNVIIPETIENLPVTTIDTFAFASSFTVVAINTTNVTTINESAFSYCPHLATILMPEVKIIRSYAVASCPNLRFVSMPKVTSINDMAFATCGALKSINISKNLSTIGSNIFSDSTMKNITIDYGTEDISKVSLYNWTQFVSKLTGWDLTTVPGKYVKNNLSTQDLVAGLTYKENPTSLTVTKYIGTVADLVLPQAINLKPVTAIEPYVFQHCDSLNSITMPNVLTIGMYGLSSCTNLKSITGNKVTTLGVSAVQSCNNLTNVSMPELTTIDQATFANSPNLLAVSFPKLTSIKGNSAFSGCRDLVSVDFPSLTVLPDTTFASCISLSDANLPLVTTVGKGALAACGLSTIVLSKVTRIDSYAFYYCSFLTTVTLSKDATTIGSYAFSGCPVSSVTLYYGTKDISMVTLDDWNAFVTHMGLVPDTIPGKYVMNDYGIRNLSTEG